MTLPWRLLTIYYICYTYIAAQIYIVLEYKGIKKSYHVHFKGKWQQKSSYLRETPKQYIAEVYYRIFVSALFGEIF